jgi:glycerol-3-phosphate dehydrogenase
MTKLSLTKSKKIILSAMLLSILIVLSRFFSIKSSFLVISFSFIPMILAAIYLGPKYAAIIAGLGDLIVTTTSHHSRNYQAGYKLATGKNLEETINSMTMVVEGARTVIAAFQYAREYNIETPIIDAVYDVLYNKKDVKSAITDLMTRSLKDE